MIYGVGGGRGRGETGEDELGARGESWLDMLLDVFRQHLILPQPSMTMR